MNVIEWTNRVIRWGFYLIFILVPLILTPWNFELFEYNKMMLTYALTVIILGAWAVKIIAEKKLSVARTPLDIPILLFGMSQLVATIFSMDPHVSWFGYYSRFNGGMFSVLSYITLYYAFVTNFTIIWPAVAAAATRPAIAFRLTRLVKVILTTASVVAIYGVLEHFGIDKDLWVQDVQSRVFSTLGQPNWLAAYIIALIPLTWALGFESIFFYSFSILFLVVLLFTRSRSGYLGLVAADVVFWGMLLWSLKSLKEFKKKYLKPFAFIHIAIFLIVFINGTYIEQVDRWVTFGGWRDRFTHKQAAAPKPQVTSSGTALESGGTESGTIRKYVWQGAINAWRGSTKNIIIGTGTETYAFAFYQFRPVGHNMTSEWDFLYNKAHNEFLNYLATTGLFGLGSYILLIGSFILWFIRQKNTPLALALFAGWTSILVTDFFGFSVVVMQLLFFLFPAIVISMHRNPQELRSWQLPSMNARTARATSLTILLILLLMIVILYRYWKADTLYASGNRLERSGQNAAAQTLTTRAILLNPGEPVYHDANGSILAALALAAATDGNATMAADLAKRSLAESDIAIATSPNNINFWKTRTKIYYTFASFDPTLNQAAVAALERALTLSPNDPKIYYNLAILKGRGGDNEKAVELLQKAKELKKNYRDAYFGLYVFFTEMKKPAMARAELQEYLDRVNPNDKDFQTRITQ